MTDLARELVEAKKWDEGTGQGPSITFELTVSGLDAGHMSDSDEEENICECVKDALGYPERLTITARVIRRQS